MKQMFLALSRAWFWPLMAFFLALPVRAEPLDDLAEALRLPEVVGVLCEEGLVYGDELQTELLSGRGGPRWQAEVTRIYDPERLTALMMDRLGDELEGADLAPLIAYFARLGGQRVTDLEIAARRALLDPDTEEAARAALIDLMDAEAPLLAQVDRFIAAGDLIEMNVIGGLNANYEFLMALTQQGAGVIGSMTEDEVLALVWGQEGEIREEVEQWLRAFLAMAYEPLQPAEMEAYIALAESPEGRRLNHAIFVAFDVMFRQVSRELGAAAARMLREQDI